MSVVDSELIVLDRVYLRLISTSETQLENVLAVLLPRLIDKLASNEPGVREKVNICMLLTVPIFLIQYDDLYVHL